MKGMSAHQNQPAGSEKPSSNGELEREIALLITQALNLDIPAADIDPEAPLYRDGLGLDSIDILEVYLVVSKRYGVEIKANSEDNQNTFRSLRALAEFIAEHRTR
jgi:acyl carrier protein